MVKLGHFGYEGGKAVLEEKPPTTTLTAFPLCRSFLNPIGQRDKGKSNLVPRASLHAICVTA